MFKKPITYTDFNGVTVTEDFYFNLTKQEVTKLNFAVDGGLEAKVQRIANTRNVGELLEIFEEIIKASYGEKSDDGKHFTKVRNGHALAEDFVDTNAYDVMFMEYVKNPDKFAEFIKKVLPPISDNQETIGEVILK